MMWITSRKIHFISQILFSVLLLYPVYSSANNRNIRFIHLTNDNGLPNNSVASICQDYKGFYWIATKNGLCKYDGKNTSVYSHEINPKNGLPNDQIKYVFEDSKHRLWVATLNGVCVYDRNRDHFIPMSTNSNMAFGRVICQARNHQIYVGGGRGAYFYDEKKNKFFPIVINNDTIKGNITAMASDNKGQLWMGTMFGGLICIDREKGKYIRFNNNQSNINSLLSNRIASLYKDKKGHIWVGTEDRGVCYYDETSRQFLSIKNFPDICVRSFMEDSEGNIWIGSENGLYIYNPGTGTLINKKQECGNVHSLSDNAIYAILRDKENNMLVGTYFGGINIFLNSFRQFSYYDYGNTDKNLSGKAVRQIIGDKNGNLWIATEDGGLNFYDSQTEKFAHFKPDKTTNSISYHNVHSLLLDRNNNLWIGTYLGGLNKYDLRTKRFTHYSYHQYPNLYVDNIFSLIEDREGYIWIGTTSGLSILNQKKNEFTRFEPHIFNSKSIDNLCEDSDGDIWISTRSNGVYCYNKSMRRIQNFAYQPNGKGIPDNYINYIFEDSKKNIWIATYEGGFCKFNKKTEKFTTYTKKDGLPSNTVFVIAESKSGDIWVSTNNGLSCLNTSNNSFTSYSVSEGLPNKQFNFNSVYKNANGVFYFGTINGMISFHPKNLQTNQAKAIVELTDFKIMGKSVMQEEDSQNHILSTGIDDVSEIRLNSTQAKSFTFEFTVPTITHATSTFFAIKLKSDKDWSYIGTQNHVTFANLPPGEYKLMIKAAFNNNWTGNEPVKTVKIIIAPPFWKSGWAYLLYTIILCSLGFAFFSFIKRRHEEKNLLLSERMESDKIKEINTLKLNFFSNISHELRTPLSLILIPIQNLLEKNAFGPDIRSKMAIVERNAVRMKNLVDELLLFSKIETKQEKICVKKGYLLSFINNICEGFKILAEDKGLRFVAEIPSIEEEVWFAPENVEKIIYNLLSNAIKYTEKGQIRVTASLENESTYTYAKIVVTDTGIGIAQEEIDHIFENYYQVNNLAKSKKNGFGIGLALTKKLILLHKGDISVNSETGRGSSFAVKLNVSYDAYLPEEIADTDTPFLENYKFTPIPDTLSKEEADLSPEGNKKQYKMLVVEDNLDLLYTYKGLFSDGFTVITAENGKEGLQKTLSDLPDIIISDVMMPEMDGYEFCNKVKARIETSHIPFILLTAKTGDEAQMEGYNCGADLYVEKPFHPTLLQKQVHNILLTKENQKKLFLKDKIELADITVNSRDKKLISDIEELIKKNIDNESFTINDILKEIGIGRTLLHLKLKNIVGLSATEFINNIRLKESLKILVSGGNVSEAAYGTGFSTPNYYSRCFKEQFGLSPSEYVSKLRTGQTVNLLNVHMDTAQGK